MQPNRTIIAVALLALIIGLASPYTAVAQQAQRESLPDLSGLSPYWNSAVNRWASFILSAAEERNLDPDLIAAVIWKESLGRAWERGPVGAVGLMGVMPFEWRPSVEELQNPWTNVAWGARTLAHTIRDGKGDLYYALAAYNGGWGQIHLRVTRGYAADVLNHYARAVAMRHGLPADGDWVAIFATEGLPGSDTITVVGPQRSLARYTKRPWVQANIPAVPVGVHPHSTVITFVDDYGVERQVNVWLVAADNSPLELSTVQTVLSPSPADYDTSELHTTPTSTPSPAPMNTPTPAPADTIAVPTAMPATPVPTPAITTVAPTLTPVPPVSPPTTTPPTTPTVECAGGPLQLNAWHIAKAWTADGWVATIFVQGHGGDCMYTYTWEGEIKGGPMPGSMTFEIYTTDHEAVIMGTAAVTSAGETVEVGLFLKPTGD